MTPTPDFIPDPKTLWLPFAERAVEEGLVLPPDSRFRAIATSVFAFSDFVCSSCLKTPAMLLQLYQSGDLDRTYPQEHYARHLGLELTGATDENDLMKRLRLFRRREMVRIAWRDLHTAANLHETLSDLSRLADACLDEALSFLHETLCKEMGRPVDDEGQPILLTILGMGKLGAGELNFSSDIDLVCTYRQNGRLENGSRTPVDFFTQLARRLIKVIGARTTLGMVFRVDMDLRPYGSSGPLAISFDALEEYFIRQGREWERYAWIKARPVAGDISAGKELLERIKPFIFRRYLDFGVYDSLREMKAGIAKQVRQKRVAHNIKLGPGGIREIEFFGQIFQLLRGGVLPALQQRPILPILDQLTREGLVPQSVTDELKTAYCFLRMVENRLQMVNDQQTHLLPAKAPAQAQLAAAMGFTRPESGWEQLLKELDAYRSQVHHHFQQLLGSTESSSDSGADGEAQNPMDAVWQQEISGETADAALRQAGYRTPRKVHQLLARLHDEPATRLLSRTGRTRLDLLLPLIIAKAANTDNPEAVLGRILQLVRAVLRRTSYLALLVENPRAIDHLVELAAASPMIISQLIRHPLLLDELMDTRTLYHPPSKSQLEQDLEARITQIDPDDLEFQMTTLAVFKQINTLRVAAADVTGTLPLMKVSDRLTDIAEVILAKVAQIAWDYLVKRHGSPQTLLAGKPLQQGFTIVAYGKTGGFEMGYGSDLDLVFLHTGKPGTHTDGKRPLDIATFFARLGQRVLHLLTTRSQTGMLYEVDMRLRPSGTSGLLVSHLDHFTEYQQTTARVWEHQALIKARPLYGDPELVAAFDHIRRRILSQPFHKNHLRREVVSMRHQLRSAHGAKSPTQFHLKQDPGGIVDIEFMVQYLILRFAATHPRLLDWTDIVRQIQYLIEARVLKENAGHVMRRAYLSYRLTAHRLTLQEKEALTDSTRFKGVREAITLFWDRLMEPKPM